MRYLFIISWLLASTLQVIGQVSVESDSIIAPEQDDQARNRGWGLSGAFELGSEYGLNPLIINGEQPSFNGFAKGAVEFDLLKLPMTLLFQYNSNPGIYGLNNYFRVEYDYERHKNKLEKKKEETLEKIDSQKDSISDRIRSAEQAGSFLRIADPKMLVRLIRKRIIESDLPDSLKDPTGAYADSSVTLSSDEWMNQASVDSSDFPNVPSDSISMENPSQDWIQFIDGVLEGKRRRVESEKEKLYASKDSLLRKRDSIENPLDSISKPRGLNRLVKDLKGLQIGMHYPDHSYFLARGMALRGMTIELEGEDYFAVVSGGKSVNPLFMTNNLLQNRLNFRRNLYNYFDFQDYTDGRLLVSGLGGWGSKGGNHLSTGVLYGSGRSNSFFADSLIQEIDTVPQRNLVFEMQGQIRRKAQTLTLTYSKSVLWDKPWENESAITSEWVDSDYRSHALRGRYQLLVLNSTGKLDAQVRWIDPEFRSFGSFGFRGDNLRYKLVYRQRLFKKLNVRMRVRRDADNILRRDGYSNVITLVGGQIRMRFSRTLNLSVSYDPVVHRMSHSDSGVVFTNKNHLLVGNLVYVPGLKRGNLVFNLSGTQYQLFNGEGNDMFSTLSILTQLSTGNIQMMARVNQFVADTSGSRSTQVMGELSSRIVSKKNLMIGLGGKYLDHEKARHQFGGYLELDIPLFRRYRLRMRAERVVFGDYFNVFNFDEWKKFPYLLSTSLEVNF